jgi:primosomal protein N' (replication factor Y)
MLSQIHESGIILGSATPSLEELYNCRYGRHTMVELKQRYHGTEDTDIEIIDTKAERRKRGMCGNISRKLIVHITDALEKGGQVMILRSRRSWAPAVQCEECGDIPKCPRCNVSMSLHKNGGSGRMVCHYCGQTLPFTGTCGKCGGPLKSLGSGTQKIEEEIAALFPQARVARLDSDTAQDKKYETQTIREFGKGEIDILVGTQMLTKGFDFAGLSLVAVIAADAFLGIQDFRADEKALQMLEQFRGRCGRRGEKGLFVIQTSQPEHPVYKMIGSQQRAVLDDGFMQERKDFNFPPFTRIIEITIRDRFEDRAVRMASALSQTLAGSFNITGPYAPAIDKVADEHIRIIRLSMKKDRSLSANKKSVLRIVQSFEKSRRYDGHININVDPS